MIETAAFVGLCGWAAVLCVRGRNWIGLALMGWMAAMGAAELLDMARAIV